ncbi:MAG TPA: helix-turn-helix transcriptional regulator [Gemmataceae bacterium]|nr:helix-turn-helix transcriptional regulator [Gemmataceae bacterium]
MPQDRFHDRLKKTMKAKGLNAYAVAKATKVSPNAVYKWLQGKRIPNFRCAVILAQVLGVSVEWLAGGE